jgi:hypothetical protein
MIATGNVTTGGPLTTAAVPVPTAGRKIRTVERRSTSPFAGQDPSKPTPPDPDAIKRLIRLGLLEVTMPATTGPAVVQKVKRTPKPRRNGRGCGWRRTLFDIDKAIALYESGLSLRATGKELGVNWEVIRAHLIERGVTLRNKGRVNVDHAQIIRLAREGLTATEIARAAGVALPTVAKHLAQDGVKAVRGKPRPMNARDDLDWDVIRARYESGVTTPTLARDHGCSTRTVRDRLIRMGVQLRDDRHLRATDHIERAAS